MGASTTFNEQVGLLLAAIDAAEHGDRKLTDECAGEFADLSRRIEGCDDPRISKVLGWVDGVYADSQKRREGTATPDSDRAPQEYVAAQGI